MKQIKLLVVFLSCSCASQLSIAMFKKQPLSTKFPRQTFLSTDLNEFRFEKPFFSKIFPSENFEIKETEFSIDASSKPKSFSTPTPTEKNLNFVEKSDGQQIFIEKMVKENRDLQEQLNLRKLELKRMSEELGQQTTDSQFQLQYYKSQLQQQIRQFKNKDLFASITLNSECKKLWDMINKLEIEKSNLENLAKIQGKVVNERNLNVANLNQQLQQQQIQLLQQVRQLQNKNLLASTTLNNERKKFWDMINKLEIDKSNLENLAKIQGKIVRERDLNVSNLNRQLQHELQEQLLQLQHQIQGRSIQQRNRVIATVSTALALPVIVYLGRCWYDKTNPLTRLGALKNRWFTKTAPEFKVLPLPGLNPVMRAPVVPTVSRSASKTFMEWLECD